LAKLTLLLLGILVLDSPIRDEARDLDGEPRAHLRREREERERGGAREGGEREERERQRESERGEMNCQQVSTRS
jgi:hypothetical protein